MAPSTTRSLALGALVVLFLSACSSDNSTEPEASAEVAEASASEARIEESWFVRTVAPLGDDRGLCIDLPGWTPTNINFDAPVIAHTCKHGWWNFDGRFDRAALLGGRLEMPFFERCLEAVSTQLGATFLVRACDGGPRQQFEHLDAGQIVLAGSPGLCISVPDRPHRDAGGDDFWMNGLVLEACGEEGADRQRWVFTEPL